jgi:hypothetical protein
MEIRSRLWSRVTSATENFFIVDEFGAQAAANTAIATFHLTVDDIDFRVLGEAMLSIPEESRKVGESLLGRARLQDSELANEHRHLVHLRDRIFTDGTLARLWWLEQSPDLLKAAGENFFTRTAERAMEENQTKQLVDQDAALPIFLDFAKWVGEETARQEQAVFLLDYVLAIYERDDLRLRLRKAEPSLPPVLGNEPQASVPEDWASAEPVNASTAEGDQWGPDVRVSREGDMGGEQLGMDPTER